jgi:hypothetical protein
MSKEKTAEKAIMEFLTDKIGENEIEGAHQISINNSFFDKYQVDIWSQTYKSGAHVPTNRIKHSFFLKFIPEDSKVLDLTPKPKTKKNIFTN